MKKNIHKKVLKVVVCSSRITKNDMHDVLKKNNITFTNQCTCIFHYCFVYVDIQTIR